MTYTVSISDFNAGAYTWINTTSTDDITEIVYEFVTLTD
jgi:hypothetical protein